MRLEAPGFLTLPNFLSISRLFLLPLILFFLATHQTIGALTLMVISWISDALDGYLARRLNQVSNLGKILDHLVDKIWVGTILVTLVLVKDLPVYLALVVILRDLLIILGCSILINFKKVILSSNVLGKVTGLFFAVLIVIHTLDNPITIIDNIKHYIIVIVTILVILSLINYSYLFLQIFARRKPVEE